MRRKESLCHAMVAWSASSDDGRKLCSQGMPEPSLCVVGCVCKLICAHHSHLRTPFRLLQTVSKYCRILALHGSTEAMRPFLFCVPFDILLDNDV